MLFRTRHWLAAALGVCLSPAALGLAAEPAAEPPRLVLQPDAVSANQKVADAIAEHLRQGGQLRHYSVDVTFRDGVAVLAGSVADQPQREEVLRIVQGVPGVERVIDRLAVAAPIRQVQAAAPPPQPLPAPAEPGQLPPPAPVPAPPARGTVVEPLPVFQAPPPSPYALNQPKMPPYAWPTFAPYNNFSRVAYPEQYPYQAWPFIGPCYPFPKVPPGWRSVKLEWEDGNWWYYRLGSQHDFWKLRYW